MRNSKKYVADLDIFGTTYKLYLFDYDCDYYGSTDFEKKRILIDCHLDYDKLVETLIHELMHAHFFECGLECYASDETLIKCLGRWFLGVNNRVAGLVYLINKAGFGK